MHHSTNKLEPVTTRHFSGSFFVEHKLLSNDEGHHGQCGIDKRHKIDQYPRKREIQGEGIAERQEGRKEAKKTVQKEYPHSDVVVQSGEEDVMFCPQRENGE